MRAGVRVRDGALDVDSLERATTARGDDEYAELLGRPLPPPTKVVDLLSSGSKRLASLADAVTRANEVAPENLLLSMEKIAFEVPTPGSQKILCVGRNYMEHIQESKREVPGDPVLFCRYEDSQVAHLESIERPIKSVQLDWEGELAVVIGSSCRYVDEVHALEVVAGYSIFNDGSVRDYQHRAVQWTAGKNFMRSGSYGPYLVTKDEIADPQSLGLETRVNDTVVQKARTATMIFSVRRLIAHITEWTRLNPGDVIATGTPAGIGNARTPQWFLKPGDELSVSVTSLDTLRNPVIDEPAPGTGPTRKGATSR